MKGAERIVGAFVALILSLVNTNTKYVISGGDTRDESNMEMSILSESKEEQRYFINKQFSII